MGDHLKLISVKPLINGQIVELEEKDIFLACYPDPEKTSVDKNLQSDTPHCMVKVFRVFSFSKEDFILWQTAEGLFSKEHIRFMGYDNEKLLEQTRNIIYKTAMQSIDCRAITYLVLREKGEEAIRLC